jgi:hypothetical protein
MQVWVGVNSSVLVWVMGCVVWSASSCFGPLGFVFQRLLLLSVRLALWARAPFDQCDLMEEELEAAQSMASNKDVLPFSG